METVIIGSGLGGITLAEELHKLMPARSIRVLTQETHGYYARPMLSHGFTRDDIEEKIILKSFDTLRALGIEVDAGCTVKAIDREQHLIHLLENGQERTLPYELLALAPGSEAFVPPSFQAFMAQLRFVNSLDDLIGLRRLREQVMATDNTPSWALIGGGLIGCEVASDMARAGDAVTLIHAFPKLMERQLEDEDATQLEKVLLDQGITLRLNESVDTVQGVDGALEIGIKGELLGPFSGVILSTGFKPRTDLAQSAGLRTNRGICVDEWLRTSDPDIFALGDAAECDDGNIYAYVLPVRQQASWLARYIAGQETKPWAPPDFKPRAKVHGFTATLPYKN
jgi:NAD(P)H-nitrite reductase large subunit